MRAARTGTFSAAMAALAMVLIWGAAPASAQPVDTGHVEVELAPAQTTVAPGGAVHVALRQKIDKGWHTYWRNPGDSGEATQIKWTLPPGWTAGEIIWAQPSRLPVGPLMNYGYSGEVLLPVPIAAPANAKAGDRARLSAEVLLLVCKDICLPEMAKLSVELLVVEGAGSPHPRWGDQVARALSESPKPAGLKASYHYNGGVLRLTVTGEALSGADLADAYFYPFDPAAIDHARPQLVERGPLGLILGLTPGYAFQGEALPATLSGVLSLADGRAYELTAARGSD